MTANHFPNLYADKVGAELEIARADLQAAIERLDECETLMLMDGDWAEFAKLADLAFRDAQAAILPLGRMGTYAIKRASFR